MNKRNSKKKPAKQERTKKKEMVYEIKSTPAKPPTPAKAEKKQRRRMSDDRVEELEAKVSELEDKIIELNAENEQLRKKPQGKPAKKWQRGKLPGERYIKTDPETGHFLEINKAEWDSLA
jgi:molecular chaperone GrpE (heat shock protein)